MDKILSTIPIIQSTMLVNRNLSYLKKKKKKSSDFVKQGTENIIGAEFIKETANFI